MPVVTPTHQTAGEAENAAPPTAHRPGWSLGLEAAGSDAVDELIREGFPASALEQLMSTLDLDREEAAALLGVSERTISRRREEGRLKPAESDRLYRMARLLERATDVLGDAKAAQRWLKEPQWALGDRTPLRFAETEAGAREVEDLLGRIEYGVLA